MVSYGGGWGPATIDVRAWRGTSVETLATTTVDARGDEQVSIWALATLPLPNGVGIERVTVRVTVADQTSHFKVGSIRIC